MPNTSKQQTSRIYSFDWLRIIACAVVVLIHCIHMFGELYNGREGLKLNAGGAYAVSFTSYWCMDLFFLVAGASTWLALRKKTARQFIKERFQRLLLPLVTGFILLVPLQTYFEQVSNRQYSGTLAQFYPFLLGNILFHGKLSWILNDIHHLWFLAYLFVFSLVALPLCLFLRREQGRVWIERLATICELPGGLLIPMLPIILVQISLRALFPAYCSVADALCWLVFYIDGYILFASPRLRQALQHQSKLTLQVAISGFLFLCVAEKMGLLSTWMYNPNYSLGCLLFQAVASLTLWSCLLLTLNAGEKYLNRNAAFLVYGSPASFWWYMLHFPIVIIVAYCLLPLHLYAPVTYLLMAVSSFAITFTCADVWQRINLALGQLNLKSYGMLAHWLEQQHAGFSSNPLPMERTITGHL